MKKIVSIAVITAALALAPTAASAHSWHKRGYHHKPEAVVLLGAGVGAGAIVAGPVGAVVGGVAVLVLGHAAHVGY